MNPRDIWQHDLYSNFCMEEMSSLKSLLNTCVKSGMNREIGISSAHEYGYAHEVYAGKGDDMSVGRARRR